jgi:hypothetical protein
MRLASSVLVLLLSAGGSVASDDGGAGGGSATGGGSTTGGGSATRAFPTRASRRSIVRTLSCTAFNSPQPPPTPTQGLLVVYLHGAGAPTTRSSVAHEDFLAQRGFHVIGPCSVSDYGVGNTASRTPSTCRYGAPRRFRGAHAPGTPQRIELAARPWSDSHRLFTSIDAGNSDSSHSSTQAGGSSPRATDGGYRFGSVWDELYGVP